MDVEIPCEATEEGEAVEHHRSRGPTAWILPPQ